MKFKFSYLLFILAVAVSSCAAYFSVWGLSQLFAGASLAVILMAGILELGKIIVTTALHRFGTRYGKSLRVYGVMAIVILMVITSAGIYGFLSNAYQKTANKLDIQKGQVTILDNKKALFQKDIDDNQKVVITKNKRIEQLSNLRSTQENRLDSARSNTGKDKVRTDIQKATDEIQKLTSDIDALNVKDAGLSDSISVYTVKTLELTSNSEVAGEVGPLKYIAELTGYPMGKVVNVLILLFIIVFHPFAIALVLMANRTLDIEKEDEDKATIQEVVKMPLIEKEPEPIVKLEEHPAGFVAMPATPEAFIHEPETPIETEVEGVTEHEDEGVNEEHYEEEIIDEPVNDAVIEPVNDTVTEELPLETEGVNEVVSEEPTPETPREPVVTTGKIELKDIREIKDRGKKNTNSIERIGANKVIKDGDNNKLFFKRS